MEGMCAIAVAVRDTRNRLLTTLSIHAPIQRFDLTTLIGLLPRLQEAARELGELAITGGYNSTDNDNLKQ